MGTTVELHGHVSTTPTRALDGKPYAWAQVVTEDCYPPPVGTPGLQIDHHRVKAQGDDARLLATLRPGDPIVVHGELGFTFCFEPERHLALEVVASRLETPAAVKPMNRVQVGGQILMEPQDHEQYGRPGACFPLAISPPFGITDQTERRHIDSLWVYAAGDLAHSLRTTPIYAYLNLRGHLINRTLQAGPGNRQSVSEEVAVVEMVATETR